MAYLGTPPFSQTVRTVTTITATASQTSFTPTGGYTVGYVDVYYNGVKLVGGSDFTASDGLTVVLTTGATANAVVEMITYGTVSMADAVRRSGDTFSGDVTFSTNTAHTGAATFANTITTTGAATFANNVTITGTANVARGLTANTLTVSTNTATIGTAVNVDANGAVSLNSTLSSEWSSSGILQVNNPSTYSTLSLATTRTVSDGNRIGSIVWEMPNNTATYRSRAEIECDMKGSTANKFGAQVKINIAPDNSTGLTGSAVFNQYGIGLGATAPSSGTGLAFPATQNASSDANTLDDYEEGSWTPSPATGSVTVTASRYVKIGRFVMCSADVTCASSTGGDWSGLPFSAASTVTGSGSGCVGYQNQNAATWNIAPETAGFSFRGPGTTQNQLTTGNRAIFQFSYFASA